MTYPKRIATVHAEQLDAELCLYDWQRKHVHTLNPTAAAVWARCDGATSPAQLAAQLQTLLDVPQAAEVVQATLQQLAAAHLLEEPEALGLERKHISRRQLLKLGVAAALVPLVSSIVAPTPVAAQSPTGSQTFNFTGAEQQFIVPLGVTAVTILASGAQGSSNDSTAMGGIIQATIPVTPGETLYVYVGGQGAITSGGFNGGGAGGTGGVIGSGGGGASDVRQGGNGLTNRVVVAGGGGGRCLDGPGGHGGYPNGQGSIGGPQSGGGGTQTSGGTGGTGNNGGANGAAGTLGTGGMGGAGPAVGSGGGGGGGGYYGGGGGGGDGDNNDTSDGDGGGGGGSGYVIPTATNVSATTTGGNLGDGQVIISW